MKIKSLSLIIFLTIMSNVCATEQGSTKKENAPTVLHSIHDEQEPLTQLRLYVITTATKWLNRNEALKEQLSKLSITPHKENPVILNSFTTTTALTTGTHFITDIFANLKKSVFTIMSGILAENTALKTQLAQALAPKETPLPTVQESSTSTLVTIVSSAIDLPGLNEWVPWRDLKSMTMQLAHDLLFENRELRKQFNGKPIPTSNTQQTFFSFTSHNTNFDPGGSHFVSQIFSTLKKNVIGFLSDLIDENKELKNHLARAEIILERLQNEKNTEQPKLVDTPGNTQGTTLKSFLKEQAEESENDAVIATRAVSSTISPKFTKPQSRRSSSQRLVSTGNTRYDNFVKSLIWQGNDLETLEPLIKAKLTEITGPQFTMAALEATLIKELNAAQTLELAANLFRCQKNSPAVLRSTIDSRRELIERHDSDLAQQRLDTAAHERAQVITKFTKRFLTEGKIIPGWGEKLNTGDREALESEIRQVVVDCYEGVIPNFCGRMEGPIQDFILLAATQTSLENLRTAIGKARKNIQWEKAQQRDEIREASTPQIESTFTKIDHHMMFSTTNTSIMQDIHLPKTLKKMKLHKPEHASIREIFAQLVASATATGFVCLPLADQDNYVHITMKAFWLRKSPSDPLTDQYEPIFLTANSVAKGIIEEFEKLTKGEYLLWVLRLSGERYFFAIHRDPKLTVISLTLNKGDKRLTGYIVNRIESAKKFTAGMVF